MSTFTYVVDANVLIQAHRLHYRFRICPGFWASLIHFNQSGLLCSIDRVQSELKKGKDQLTKWSNQLPKGFFQSTKEPEVVKACGEVSRWVLGNSQYKEVAKNEFLRGADPWLIAYASTHNCRLITSEQPAPDSKTKIKIPDVCNAIQAEWGCPFDMLEEAEAIFEFVKHPIG